jgi:hypothetical protein
MTSPDRELIVWCIGVIAAAGFVAAMVVMRIAGMGWPA